MQLPEYIRKLTDEIAAEYRPAELKMTCAAISEAYLNNKKDGSRLVTSAIQAAAYCAARMPATYAAVYAALEAATKGCAVSFDNMLDAGAGTGAAFFAAHELLGITEATLAEREKAMLRLAKRFACAGGLNAEFVNVDLSDCVPSGKYDLVVSSYALNEMTADVRKKLLCELLSRTNKLLLIVEPGTPDAFSLQREIRTYLTEQGAVLAAPCPEGSACRLSADDWCHFTCRVERSRLHKFLKGGDSPYEDEKFTYSAFCTDGSVPPCEARVLRRPEIEKGRVSLSLCSAKGIETCTLHKKDNGYKEARKLGAGDQFSLSTP